MRATAICLPLLAITATPPPPPQMDLAQSSDRSEIVVRGTRDRDQQIRQFIKDLTPAPVRGQLARFEAPVCPVVLGVAPKQAAAIEDRIRQVAAAAKIPVARPGCVINVAVF